MHILSGLTRLPGKADLPSIDDGHGHGTCVASIASSNIGIMTKGTLVVAKVNTGSLPPTANELLEAFAWAVNHIAHNNRGGKSVINFSWGKSTVYWYIMTFVYNDLLFSDAGLGSSR